MPSEVEKIRVFLEVVGHDLQKLEKLRDTLAKGISTKVRLDFDKSNGGAYAQIKKWEEKGINVKVNLELTGDYKKLLKLQEEGISIRTRVSGPTSSSGTKQTAKPKTTDFQKYMEQEQDRLQAIADAETKARRARTDRQLKDLEAKRAAAIKESQGFANAAEKHFQQVQANSKPISRTIRQKSQGEIDFAFDPRQASPNTIKQFVSSRPVVRGQQSGTLNFSLDTPLTPGGPTVRQIVAGRTQVRQPSQGALDVALDLGRPASNTVKQFTSARPTIKGASASVDGAKAFARAFTEELNRNTGPQTVRSFTADVDPSQIAAIKEELGRSPAFSSLRSRQAARKLATLNDAQERRDFRKNTALELAEEDVRRSPIFSNKEDAIKEAAFRRGVLPRELRADKTNRKFIDADRLREPGVAQDILLSGLIGGPLEALGGAVGASIVPGRLGVTGGALIAQQTIRFVEETFERIGESLKRAAEAGISFETSILGISSVLQATTRVSGPGGAELPLGEQLKFQQGQARKIQQTARARLLPIGIAGERESTLVQAIVAGAAQRGIELTPEETATLAERLGGAIQAQRPELLNNSSQLRRDIEDLLGGLPNRTILSSLVKGFAPNLGKSVSGADLIRNSQGLAQFPVALAGSGSNPIVGLQKLNAALDQLTTVAGDKLLLKLVPLIEKLGKVVGDDKVVDSIGRLAESMGELAGAVEALIPSFAGATVAVTDFVTNILKSLKVAYTAPSSGLPGDSGGLLGIAENALTPFGLGGGVKSLASFGTEFIKNIQQQAFGEAIPQAGLNAAFAGAFPNARSSARSQFRPETQLRSLFRTLGIEDFENIGVGHGVEDPRTLIEGLNLADRVGTEAFRGEQAGFKGGILDTARKLTPELATKDPKAFLETLKELQAVSANLKLSEAREKNAPLANAVTRVGAIQSLRDREQFDLSTFSGRQQKAGADVFFTGEAAKAQKEVVSLQEKRLALFDQETAKLAKESKTQDELSQTLKKREQDRLAVLSDVRKAKEAETKLTQETFAATLKLLDVEKERLAIARSKVDTGTQEGEREDLKLRLQSLENQRLEIADARNKPGLTFGQQEELGTREAQRKVELAATQREQILQPFKQQLEQGNLAAASFDFAHFLEEAAEKGRAFVNSLVDAQQALAKFDRDQALRSLGRTGRLISAAEKVRDSQGKLFAGGGTSAVDRLPVWIRQLIKGDPLFDEEKRNEFEFKSANEEFKSTEGDVLDETANEGRTRGSLVDKVAEAARNLTRLPIDLTNQYLSRLIQLLELQLKVNGVAVPPATGGQPGSGGGTGSLPDESGGAQGGGAGTAPGGSVGGGTGSPPPPLPSSVPQFGIPKPEDVIPPSLSLDDMYRQLAFFALPNINRPLHLDNFRQDFVQDDPFATSGQPTSDQSFSIDDQPVNPFDFPTTSSETALQDVLDLFNPNARGMNPDEASFMFSPDRLNGLNSLSDGEMTIEDTVKDLGSFPIYDLPPNFLDPVGVHGGKQFRSPALPPSISGTTVAAQDALSLFDSSVQSKLKGYQAAADITAGLTGVDLKNVKEIPASAKGAAFAEDIFKGFGNYPSLNAPLGAIAQSPGKYEVQSSSEESQASWKEVLTELKGMREELKNMKTQFRDAINESF